MIGSAKTLLIAIALGCVSFAQTTPAPATNAADSKKAGAYYNFAMGHLYAELGGSEGNKTYLDKAIQHYQDALKLDPSAGIIAEELTDLYVALGRLDDAVAEAEGLLKQNPDNVDARRMLGRVYMKALSNSPGGKLDETFLQKAIEQYKQITAKDPKDVESWATLGRLYGYSNKSPEAEKAYNAALAVDPENEDALTGLATLYADLGDTARAIDKLKAATAKNPSPGTLVFLAKAYEDQKDWKDAADALRRAMELAPDNTRLARGLARDLLFSDQTDEALKLYQELANDEPRDPEPPLRIAEIYRTKHDFAKARESLDKAKKLDPEYPEIRYEEINLLEAEGKTREAGAALKALLDDTAKKSYSAAEAAERGRLFEQLGAFYRRAAQYPEAVEAFKQMSVLDSSLGPQQAMEVIETYQVAKDYEAALREADSALKKFPKERGVVVAHADVLADQGKIDQAAGEVRGLLEGKHDFQTQLALAQVYEKGKRFNEMGQALDAAEKLSSSKDEKMNVYFQRGSMYERMKKYDASEAEFRRVLELDPDNANAMNYLGYTLADRGVRLDEAYQLIKKAVDLEPDNGAYLDSLGWVNYRLGKLNEAEGLLVKALDRIGGSDPTVHDHLGDVYAKLGKTREAITQWQASLKGFQTSASGEVDPDEVAKVNQKLDEARVRLARETKQ